MTITRAGLGKEVVGSERISRNLRLGRYCLETFMMEPFAVKQTAFVTPGGTSLDVCHVMTGRNTFEYTFAGDITAGFLPVLASEGGYNWAMTTDALNGVELNFGGTKDGHPRHHVGATENFFARILLATNNASGVDLFFGFRRVAAYAATLTEYSDIAGIRVLGNSASTDADFFLVTNLNNAGATDYTAVATGVTGLEDATTIELEVRSVNGKCFFFINGAENTRATYTYDSGDVFTPVLRMIQTTDLASQIKTFVFECGPLEDRDLSISLNTLAGATT